jgi:hypothetical protein
MKTKSAAATCALGTGHEYLGHFGKAENINKGHNTVPNPKAPLGQGGRFAALKSKLAKRPGVTNPAGLAAFIGRKKYGAKKMANLAAGGK